METKIIILLGLVCFGLALLCAIIYIDKRKETKTIKRLEMIIDFLIIITSKNNDRPNLDSIIKIDIDILEKLSPLIGEYYKKNFFGLTTKISVREVDEYVKSINGLPESPQKDFISAILKKELFNQPTMYEIANFIFHTVKIYNSTDRDLCLFEFLFGDTEYLQKNKQRIVYILNECKKLFESIHVEEQLKENMIDDFDELLKLVK